MVNFKGTINTVCLVRACCHGQGRRKHSKKLLVALHAGALTQKDKASSKGAFIEAFVKLGHFPPMLYGSYVNGHSFSILFPSH